MRKKFETRNRENRKATHDLAEARVRMLEKLAEIRDIFSPDEAVQYFRILYHTLLIENEEDAALQEARQKCTERGLSVPQEKIDVLLAQKKQNFTNINMIELLNITPEEAEAIGIWKNINAEKEAEKNEIFHIDQDIRIVALYLQGYGYEKISNSLPPKYTASKSTIRRRIKELTDNSRRISLDDIDFYNQRRYYGNKPVIDDDLGNRRLGLYYMQEGFNVYIYGEAGVGKSTLIDEFCDNYLKPEKILKVSMTGVAAQHIQGCTIHSKNAFNLECRAYGKNEPVTDEQVASLHEISVVVIDEISTVRVDVFRRIMQMIWRAEELYGTKIQVILSGDVRQLPPVATHEDLEHIKSEWNLKFNQRPFFFVDEEVWDAVDFKPIFLYTVKRQSDANYVTALRGLLKSQLNSIAYFNRRYDTLCCTDYSVTHLCAQNVMIDKINSEAIALHRQDASFRRFKCGPLWSVWEGVQNESNLPEEEIREEYGGFPILEVFVGLQIMTIINKGNSYQNGTIGVITAISDTCITMKCMEDGRIVKIRKERMYSRKRDGFFLIQFPIVPAVAISIHKAQGCTFDEAILHPEECKIPYQLYVGCSRVREINNLRLAEKIRPEDVKTDPYVEEFCRKFGRLR